MSNGSNGSSIFDSVKQSRKPKRGGGRSAGPIANDSDAFPCLEHLLTCLPPGAAKGSKPASISFFVYNGRLSCAVNLRSMRTSGYYSFDGFQDAFSRLETGLAEGKVDWREDE